MASGFLEAPDLGAVDWTPRRMALDPRAFECGRVGPLCIGPEIRGGPFGPVQLALAPQFDMVLEFERLDVSWLESDPEVSFSQAGVDGLAVRLLERLNHCVGLRHAHVATVLGAGLENDVPYVLRAHTLGRTLSDMAEQELRPPAGVAAGILYSVAEGTHFLRKSGPYPGVCSVGRLDPHAVHIGWDGGVRLLGAGLALVGDERLEADLAGLTLLAESLDPNLADVVADAQDLADAVARIRRARRDDCPDRQKAVGAWFRRADGEGCDALRRFFSLDPLH